MSRRLPAMPHLVEQLLQAAVAAGRSEGNTHVDGRSSSGVGRALARSPAMLTSTSSGAVAADGGAAADSVAAADAGGHEDSSRSTPILSQTTLPSSDGPPLQQPHQPQHQQQQQQQQVQAMVDSHASCAPRVCQNGTAGPAGGVEVEEQLHKEILENIMQWGVPSTGGTTPGWGQELEAESVVTVSSSGGSTPCHRLYVQTSPTSMRLATVIVPED